MRKLYIILSISSLLFSCSSDEFSRICNYQIKTKNEPLVFNSLIGTEVELLDSETSTFNNIIIYDSLLFAYQMGAQDGYFYHVYNLNNSENLGHFISKGRAKNESLGLAPIKQLQVENGQLICYTYDYLDQKSALWNVSRSLDYKKTIFDSTRRMQSREEPYSHLFYLPNNKFAAHSVLYYKPAGNNPIPDYYLGSTTTNEITENLNLYNRIITSGEHPSAYLQTEDNIKPDMSKIVIAMQYQPHIAILDLDKKMVNGINIRNGVISTSNDLHSCFCSIDVDDNYIYALFLGIDAHCTLEEARQTESVLYKINWNGDIVKKYIFSDRPIFRIAIDRSSKSSFLYGVDINYEKVYKYNLNTN